MSTPIRKSPASRFEVCPLETSVASPAATSFFSSRLDGPEVRSSRIQGSASGSGDEPGVTHARMS
ncbi:MAG: hypothetical protein R3B70_24265 [Polyangiaceae bacterium]